MIEFDIAIAKIIMTKYQPKDLEKKWQEKWRETKIYTPDLKAAKKPFYALMMFPYPSAAGLHAGNFYPFTAIDISARFRRMQGYDVFEPIGLDAFGIHSENFALKTNTNPMELTEKTAKKFYEQLESTGNSFDWTRTLESHKPEYYKWTQWIFVRMFKEGLAVQKEASVNWCPSCLTVLADEQVIGGKCERCSTEVIQKKLKQWFFKITEYADTLLANLDSGIWSERIRQVQTNWIGRSEGVLVTFGEVEVFTTRIDTVFGATFVVLSPEHPLVNTLTNKEQKQEVEGYIKAAKKKSELERQEGKDKTGVFTGGYVKNPLTKKDIPVWVADYVLSGYGTGAIMAVPGHDIRDYEFAKKYKLEIKEVIKSSKTELPYSGEGILINSGDFNNLNSEVARKKISEYIAKHKLGSIKTQYHLRDWLISRQRYWGPPIPIIYCDKCGTVPVPEEDLPVILPKTDNFRPTGTGKSPLASIPEFVNTTCPKCGGPSTRETDVSDNFLDSAWYFYRYPSVGDNNQIFDPEITKKWLPVDLYMGGFEHALLHLMYTRFITLVFQRIGLVDFEEPFKKFIDNGHILSEGTKMSKSKGNVVNPDDYVNEYGADTLRMYLMFLAPITEGGDFRKEGVNGIYRFLQRIWNLVLSENKSEPSEEELKSLNRTIKAVEEDLSTYIHFNTAIARMMELLNVLSKQGGATLETKKTLLKLLAPFAPHITEELWERLGEEYSIHTSTWPKVDKKYLEDTLVNIAVTINGKVRGVIEVDKNLPEKVALEKGLALEKVAKFIGREKIKKTIYIPGKILNILI